MSTQEVNLFFYGWRGFLLGTRRAWHAHEQNLAGHRQGFLVGNLLFQTLQLRRAVSLMGETFARGGQPWGFGFGFLTRVTPWGALYSKWRPGTLSNHFLVRIRRVHLLRRLRPLFGSRRARRRRRRARLVRRWTRLYRRGQLPPSGYLGRVLQKKFILGGLARRLFNLVKNSNQNGGSHNETQPREGFVRLRGGRAWWRANPGLTRLSRGQLFFPRVGPRGVPHGGLRVLFQQVLVRRAHQRVWRVKTNQNGSYSSSSRLTPVGSFFRPLRNQPSLINPRGVRRGRRPRGWSPRGVQKHQGQPFWFPSLVLGGGFTLLGSTLLEEVSSLGVPLVYFGGGVTSSVRAGLLPVGWNSSFRSLEGVIRLVEALHTRGTTRGVWRTLWRRLVV